MNDSFARVVDLCTASATRAATSRRDGSDRPRSASLAASARSASVPRTSSGPGVECAGTNARCTALGMASGKDTGTSQCPWSSLGTPSAPRAGFTHWTMCASPGNDASCNLSSRNPTAWLGCALRLAGMTPTNGFWKSPEPFFNLPSLEPTAPRVGTTSRSLARLIARSPVRDRRSISAVLLATARSRSLRRRRRRPPLASPAPSVSINDHSSERAAHVAALRSVSIPATYPPRARSTLRRHHNDSGLEETSSSRLSERGSPP